LLTQWDDAGVATFRLFLNPLVSLIWLGGLLLLGGTAIAVWPATQVARRPVPGTAPARSPVEGSLADA
jgi:cytochrome c-type biogenesis protein CcmF